MKFFKGQRVLMESFYDCPEEIIIHGHGNLYRYAGTIVDVYKDSVKLEWDDGMLGLPEYTFEDCKDCLGLVSFPNQLLI